MREACSKMIPSVPARISYYYFKNWLAHLKITSQIFKVNFFKKILQNSLSDRESGEGLRLGLQMFDFDSNFAWHIWELVDTFNGE